MNPRGETGRPADAGGEYPALVRAVARGDRDAMEQLLMQAQEVAYRFSMTVCGHAEDAEDVMQEALLRTYKHAASIKEPRAFRSWLYRTVKNACLMRRRRHVDEPRRLMSLDELLPTPEGGGVPIDVADPGRRPDEVVMNLRLRRRLNGALRQLPAPFRMVVFLREMEGLSTREVAEVMGISEANVKTRLHRAHLFLRRALEVK